MKGKKAWRYLLGAVVGGLLAVSLLSATPYVMGPFHVVVRASGPGSGITEVRLPPLGTVRAATHSGIVDLVLSLERVDVDLLSLVPGLDPDAGVIAGLSRDAESVFRLFVVRLLLLAFLGGMLGARVVGIRTWRTLATGGLVAMLLVGAMVGLAFVSYDTTAFSSPQYTGILNTAPWLIDALTESLGEVRDVDERLGRVSENIYRLFRGIEALEPLPQVAGDMRVLVISDIHNSPVGVSLVVSLVGAFGVDLVLDAGDLTDFGTAMEGDIVSGIRDLGVPYVLAPGNHDAPVLIDQIEDYPNVFILTGQTLLIDGLAILGSPDPAAASFSPAIPTGLELDDQVNQLAGALAGGTLRPFFLVAHNPLVAREFLGQVPVVVAGHTHRVLVREERGSLYLNPGTTGAAGIRGIEALSDQVYTALLVHLSSGNGFPEDVGRGFTVRAVDILSFQPVSQSLNLERRLFNRPPPGP